MWMAGCWGLGVLRVLGVVIGNIMVAKLSFNDHLLIFGSYLDTFFKRYIRRLNMEHRMTVIMR